MTMGSIVPNSIAQLDRRHLTINPEVVKEGWVLKKLSQKHKTIIALHAQNVSRIDIADVAGCTPEYVSMIVAQPLAQSHLHDIEKYMDSRLRQLYTKSIDAIERGLDNEDSETSLKAARLQLEASHKLKDRAEDRQSAEDVVSALLKQATVVAIGQHVQVNTGD